MEYLNKIYRSLDELPDAVKQLPKQGQRQWRNVFNSVWNQLKGREKKEREREAFQRAWGVIRRFYIKNPKTGKWERKKMEKIEKSVEFIKVDKKKQIVYGVVYEPDTVDADGDFATSEEIEKAAHKFMKDYNNISIMHERIVPSIKVVESYIAPVDFLFGNSKIKKGTWLIAVHVGDKEIWEKIENEEYTGFSMGGTGKRR
jgi:cation transport regulator ChaB